MTKGGRSWGIAILRENAVPRCLAILEGYKKVLHREPFSLSV